MMMRRIPQLGCLLVVALSCVTNTDAFAGGAAPLLQLRRSGAMQGRMASVRPAKQQVKMVASWMPNFNFGSNTKPSKLEGDASDQNIGILLLNLGGPEKLSEVEDFLFNLFNDEDIIRLPGPVKPLQGFIARYIASGRAPQSREAYASIGGGSPLTKLTTEQGDKLAEELGRRGVEAKSYVGMRYWYPFTEEAVDQILADGINRLVILPMYPQYSISTTGSSMRLLDQMIKKDSKQWDPRVFDHTVVPDWFDHPGFVKAQAKFINRELAEFKNIPDEVKVLFSAHGVPESYIKAGDPYKDQIEKCVELIMLEVNKDHPGKFSSDLSFQSKVGPVKWLDPYTEVVLEEMGKGGLKNVVVVPLSFVQEHVETLEEIDQEFKEVAEEHGIEKFKRVPALNSDPDFINCLADITVDALTKPSLRVSETLDLYQKVSQPPSYSPFELGVTSKAEQINGRIAMLALASLAVTQVIKSGCPDIAGPAIAGKEPFCAAFSADGWQWIFNLLAIFN
mmetsp:Transcript_52688/g.124701  ORF Transcript_52688/g.124701 Transcript_52688/m.124701 type:complete len:507 (-) Transcript_52688:151-1671(-)